MQEITNPTTQQLNRLSSYLDTPLLSLFKLDWEKAIYLLILVVAIVTRFWDLGARGMSHDESLHALYAWKLYAGQGYQHNPMMHGPFLFHFNALIYFLFGDNDYTSRISTALFGVVLVMLPYFMRRWLGRVGALLTSVMLLISPSILYYSRYIRHDALIVVWVVILLIAFFRYL
ncbi:MAG: TIGR03663 family protein, partial [Anaerolineae bacterium]|nr:TIGR03663 family protein [Anaerolineae bacterium]